MINSSDYSILDFPDEILVKIILHLRARDRLALGNSCQRFNNLVFGDEELLRNLDFSSNPAIQEESNIQQYFNHENTYKKILKMNTGCMQVVGGWSSLIGKAINLVELNIQETFAFESVDELSRFLKPLVHLKRLSVCWPMPDEPYSNDPYRNQVLGGWSSRLTYLSLRMEWYNKEFTLISKYCQQLKELRMVISQDLLQGRGPWCQRSTKLSNLKFVQLVANLGLGWLTRHIMSIVPNPDEWTEFYLDEPDLKVYLERNVEICAELSRVKEMPLPRYIASYRDTDSIDEGWLLVYENLLSEVIRITHKDVPEEFCCLSSPQYSCSHPCLLEIGVAKELLKDPGYQISCLYLSHRIHKNCDVHLLASAFPDLTKLVLAPTSDRNWPHEIKPLHRRLRKKRSLVSEEDNDTREEDSSFKLLVENTPRLKVLVISPGHWEQEVEDWDFNALHLISGWKNLTVIRLYNIPITDEKFLIDIGKECEKLEALTLKYRSPDYLAPYTNFSFESELLQMLQHCKNLRQLSIRGIYLRRLSEMFNILSNCSRLAALRLQTITDESDPRELTSSVEKMLRQCKKLNGFSTNIRPWQTCDEFRLTVERIISELNRSICQIGFRIDNEDFFRVPFPCYE